MPDDLLRSLLGKIANFKWKIFNHIRFHNLELHEVFKYSLSLLENLYGDKLNTRNNV